MIASPQPYPITMSSTLPRRLATGVASVCLAAGVTGAQQAPIGIYHSRTFTLELTAAGQARFSNAFGPLIVASFAAAADTITLRDERGPAACGATGR